LKILKDTGHLRALEVLSNKTSAELVPTEIIPLLLRHRFKDSPGAYEGISLQHEIEANSLVSHANKIEIVNGGDVKLREVTDGNLLTTVANNLETNLGQGIVWWNPRKYVLPKEYIKRKLSYMINGSSPEFCDLHKELRNGENKFLVILDKPGVGKSTEMTNIELKLRSKLISDRIVIRVNLLEKQDAVMNFSAASLEQALVKIAPYIPLKSLKNMPRIKKFLLLDGLDEIFSKHKDAVIKLLKFLKCSDISVVLTSRTHLKDLLVKEFKIGFWTITPFSVTDQDEYLKNNLAISKEQIASLREKLPVSIQELLANPLMLYMLVDVIRETGGGFLTATLNIYDLYASFIDKKHDIFIIEKSHMRVKPFGLEETKKTMLEHNMPYYYYTAIMELVGNSILIFQSSVFKENVHKIAKDPEEHFKADLIRYGLILEGEKPNSLVFKHRSFAEFFYAKLLMDVKCPQVIRDMLFGFIYGPYKYTYLENVAVFLNAKVKTIQSNEISINLTPKWLLNSKKFSENSATWNNFVEYSRLDQNIVSNVLFSLVIGDPDDLKEAFRIIAGNLCKQSLLEVFEWIKNNTKWCKKNLFKRNQIRNCNSSRLIVAITLLFKQNKTLFSEEQIRSAIESCDLVFTIFVIQPGNTEKWNQLEKYIPDKLNIKELFMKLDHQDFLHFLRDINTVWKFYDAFSTREIMSLTVSPDERKTDELLKSPLTVATAINIELISEISTFANLRGMFGDCKGKTVFEINFEFALQHLWGELLDEFNEKNHNGIVTKTLREALQNDPTPSHFFQIENKIVLERGCCKKQPNFKYENLMKWIVDDGRIWEKLSTFPWRILPYVMLYHGTFDIVIKIIEKNYSTEIDNELGRLLLCVFIASHPLKKDNSDCFHQVKSFVKSKIYNFKGDLKILDKVLNIEQSKIQQSFQLPCFKCEATPLTISALCCETSLVEYPALVNVMTACVAEVVELSRCCDLTAKLSQLKPLLLGNEKEILLSSEVLCEWKDRFWTQNRRKGFNGICGLKGVMRFYIEVLGDIKDWMKGEDVLYYLLRGIPVEIMMVFQDTEFWEDYCTDFRDLTIQWIKEISLFREFFYKTEAEWTCLLDMSEEIYFPLNKETFYEKISSVVAVPLIRAMIRKYGVAKTSSRLGDFWEQICIHKSDTNEDSIETHSSLLHLAIELNELEQVKRLSFPGLLTWKNQHGNDASSIAQETFRENHPIVLHLQNCYKALKMERYTWLDWFNFQASYAFCNVFGGMKKTGHN